MSLGILGRLQVVFLANQSKLRIFKGKLQVLKKVLHDLVIVLIQRLIQEEEGVLQPTETQI